MLSWCKWLLVCNDVPRGIWGITESVDVFFPDELPGLPPQRVVDFGIV